MAYLHTVNCKVCGKEFQTINNNYTCSDCHKIEEDKKYKKYMIDIREGKTIEQRIEQIEDWIYKNKDKIHSSHPYDTLY